MRPFFGMILFTALILLAASWGCSNNQNQGTVQKPSGTGGDLEKVDAILVNDPSCDSCRDLTSVTEQLKGNVLFSSIRTVSWQSQEGEELVWRHNISRIPTLLLSENVRSYPTITETFLQANVSPVNGFFVLQSPPLYLDTATGALRGQVNLTFLVDQTCSSCFNAKLLQTPLLELGVVITGERNVDSSSPIGQQLIEQYRILKVPTIILQGDLSLYRRFNQAWMNVGTIEKDGTYVFRNIETLNPAIIYRNVTSGTIVIGAPKN